MPPRQFGHERDARILDAAVEQVGLAGVAGKRDRRVDGLAVVAGGQNRRGPEPLISQIEHGVDVVARREHAEAVHCGGAQFRGRPFRAVRHLLAHPPHLETVCEGAQGRQVTAFPLLAETDDAHAELHGTAASPGVASSAAISSSRRSPLSAMSLRHHAPAQRISLTAV